MDHFYGDDTPDNDTHQHQFLRSRIGNEPDGVDEPPFAVEEVLEHLKWMNPKKAPGIDGLTSDICLQFTINYPELITGIMNRCLELHYFPQQWKRAEVKIIPKPSKTDYSELSSFRPIGLLPVFGKLLEKLYIKRLIYCATKAGLLNGRQFGFKEQTSTITAIDTALSIVKAAKKNGKQVLGVSLDIRSAFDNAWWPALFERLRAIRCPKNIFHLIESYTMNRTVTLEYAGARVTKNNTKGCIQGSACGPILWNVILDELLEAELPSGCHLQAFADDVLLIVSAKDVNTLQTNTNRALEIILEWGQSVKLTFGPTKTQAIAFTRKAEEAHLIMGRHTLAFQRSIKFLGMIIDRKLLFADHVKYVVGKAMRIFNKLCIYTRPTWGAHPDNVQTIYRQVIEPTITYAAGIWGQAAKKRYVRKLLESAQRGFAIKAIRAFRTVSTVAAVALAQFVPLDLRVLEVHEVETVRLKGATNLIPRDIQYERPTPVHELLHPSKRISIECADLNSENLEQETAPIQIYTDGSKLENGGVGAAFVCFEGSKVIYKKEAETTY
ncbi:unnamed protein product [Parnassius apollo]|uniref:(apollo) hypothetical protein n=1 Tax=Parnassius apollo TaxID=110799 RepID=A0A8S3X881_PARAO|nr:unnamed protein product [Parnassius apollo]